MAEASGKISTRMMVEAIKNLIEPAIIKIKQVQGNETILESIPEVPLVQIYLDKREPLGTNTNRNTFGGQRTGELPVKVKKTTINLDVYSRQRSNIGEDISVAQDLADEIEDLLDSSLVHKPYLGIKQIEAISFRFERVIFEYNSNKFIGVRFILDLTTM